VDISGKVENGYFVGWEVCLFDSLYVEGGFSQACTPSRLLRSCRQALDVDQYRQPSMPRPITFRIMGRAQMAPMKISLFFIDFRLSMMLIATNQ
jgi:hypothetical protein